MVQRSMLVAFTSVSLMTVRSYAIRFLFQVGQITCIIVRYLNIV
jgi:hypothetical protein